MSASADRGEDTGLDMLVIQYGDRTVKGYSPHNPWLAEDPNSHIPPAQFQPLGSSVMEAVPLGGVKAIFFVKSFEGKSHDDLRFHDHLPAPDCLWVRATFQDGEVIEGLIANNPTYVLHPGFYMSPIDPEGNNWLIYVLKNKLANFQVLGLRPAPKNMPGLAAQKPATVESKS
ncbi:MAG TPA: hypothetical protein VN612_12940 [Acidobacteriaceae bacterium]|nr:hypothetical protein [Acidobacteriaceae bacterium]